MFHSGTSFQTIMEQARARLGPDATLTLEPPLDEPLLKQFCQALSDIEFPEDYLAFLRSANGLNAPDGWLYSAADALQNTNDYHVARDIAGAVLIGTDGGGDGFALVHRGGQSAYFSLNMESPKTKSFWSYMGDSFATFLEAFLDVDRPNRPMPALPKALPKAKKAKTKVEGLFPLCKAREAADPRGIPEFAFSADSRHAYTTFPWRCWELETRVELPYEHDWTSVRCPKVPGPLILWGDQQLPYDSVVARRAARNWISLPGRSFSLCSSPDGNRVVCSTIKNPDMPISGIWDLGTAALVMELPRSTDGNYVCTAVFSPDSRFFTWADFRGGQVAIHQAADGKRLYQLQVPPMSRLAFTPEGRIVACGQQLSVYELPTGTCLLSVPLLDIPPGFAVVDDARVLLGHSDGTVRMLDLHDGKEITRFAVTRGACDFLGVSPDGRWALLSGEKASQIQVWRISL